jgi:hypothetical protein
MLDINVTKRVHSTLHSTLYAKLKKKWKEHSRFSRDVLLLFGMFALRKDERKLQYSRSNILGLINTGYFTSDNVPNGIKKCNAQYTFRISEKSWLMKLKYPTFFGNG